MRVDKEQRAETLDVKLFWTLARWESSGPGLRDREKSTCERLSNVEGEYDPRTKKKRRGLNALRRPSASFVEAERRSKALRDIVSLNVYIS